MRDEGFRRAMNAASPTPEQRERMRAALTSQLPQEKHRYQSRPRKDKRFAWLPAVAALLAVAVGGGLALMKQALPTARKPDAVSVESTADSTVETTDYTRRTGHPHNLKVLMSFPEYQARQVMERYGADKRDALAQQYGLTVEEEGTDTDGWELANQLGIQKGSDGFTVTGGRYYEKSGASSFNGTTTMEGAGNWTYPISYRVCFNAWGAVVQELPVLEEYSAYNQWTYTASNGAILILALGQDSGVIYGLADGGFYVVYTQDNRIGDILSGEHTMEEKDLEAFAETFRFPVNAYQTALAKERQYATVLAQYMDVMEGGSGRWDQDAAAAIRARGKESFGYTFWDLDGDGNDELLMTDGTYLYGVYTGSGVTAGPVLHDDGETAYLICADGTILQREDDAFHVYRVEGPKLMTVESMSAQSDPTAPWLRFTKEGTTVLTEEEYDQVRKSYRYIALPVTPLFSWSGYGEYVQERLRGTLETPYEAVLEDYRTAIALDWDPARCSEEGVSLLAASVESTGDIGYFLRDLDADGEEELLITDGSTLYGVYTLENGKAKSILLSWERCYYYLCEDGYLYAEGSNSAAVTVYEFYLLKRKNLVTAETLMTDYSADPEHPWFRGSTGTDDTVTPITKEEFNRALSAHGEIRKDLSFTPLSQA